MGSYGPTKSPATAVMRFALMLAFVLISVVSCTRRPRVNSEDPYWKDNDTKPVPEMGFEEPNLWWTSIDRTVFVQSMELLDIDRNIRKISGRMTPAINVNVFDEVPNSSWFTNRHGLPPTRLTADEIYAGPRVTEGPDTTGPWRLFRPKVGGATIGFWIEDSRGDQYIIKPDPSGSPRLASGAAAIGSRFFHACGYNVPQESIVFWRPEQIVIDDDVTFTDLSGKRRSFTSDDLEDILSRIEIQPDGRIRSLASLNVGNVKGPFMYMGTRKDDPNDWCPHEHRRELRGLFVIGSLINHYDLKAHNSMDVYVGESGAGYLKHYLMDFGSVLGSQGRKAKEPILGYANAVDVRDILVSIVTLGLKTWPHEYAQPFEHPSIGYFESELFEPDKFDVIYPNPAFEQLTDQDAYWAAKIVMAFTEDDLRALVRAGHYSDPDAEEFLLRTLTERQQKIGRHWFGRVNPLDFPDISSDQSGVSITFRDLAVDYGLEPEDAVYNYELLCRGTAVVEPSVSATTAFTVSWDDLTARTDDACNDDRLLELRIRTQRASRDISKPAIFWIKTDPLSREASVVGIEHPG